MKTLLRSNVASLMISALIWIVITLATGGSAVFAFVGGIACGIVVYAVQLAFRRLVLGDKRLP